MGLHPILKRRVRDRINRGVKFLNANYPTWLDTIDLDILDLSSSAVCVLGQTNGGWEEILRDHSLSNQWLEIHGFLNDNGSSIEYSGIDVRHYVAYADLTEAWSRKIEKLLKDKAENARN